MNVLEGFRDLHIVLRILVIVGLAFLAAFAIRATRAVTSHVLGGPRATRAGKRDFAKQYPKLATVTSLLVSAVTFAIFFVALGLILNELHISLTAYLATASVVGLAVGFGSQGLVQDVVIGLTLVFSDAIDIGDMVELSGQIGRVEQIGLRFTIVTNIVGERVYVPNRNITLVGRFPEGVLRAFVDIQIPRDVDQQVLTERVAVIARSMRAQHPAIILTDPVLLELQETSQAGWSYLRVDIRIWPGQQSIIESTFRQRVLAALRQESPDYPDWMIAVTYPAD